MLVRIANREDPDCKDLFIQNFRTFTMTLILPIFFCPENVYFLPLLHIFKSTSDSFFIMEANTLNSDQTAQVSKYIEIGTCLASQKLLAIYGEKLIFTRNIKIFTCPAA